MSLSPHTSEAHTGPRQQNTNSTLHSYISQALWLYYLHFLHCLGKAL